MMDITTTPRQDNDAELIGAYFIDAGQPVVASTPDIIFHAALEIGLKVMTDNAKNHFGEDLLKSLFVGEKP